MVRTRDQEMTDTEKIVNYSRFPREGYTAFPSSHVGKQQGQSGGRSRGGNCEQESLLWFPRRGGGEAG